MTEILNKSLLRTVFAAALLALAFAAAPHQARSQTLGIAAVVNDDVISRYDLEARIMLLIATSNQKDTPELRRRLMRQVLNRLIDEKLKTQEADRLNIQVSKQELENAYTDLEKRNNLPRGGLTRFLKSKGIDQLVLLDQLEASIAWVSVVGRVFGSQVSISEEEIDEVINEIKANKGKPEYLTSEIFLQVSNPNLAGEVLNNANRLIEQLARGADFAALARNYSQSATAAVGGDLGWVRRGQLADEIYKVLTTLDKSEVSRPLRGVSGYHIILKRDQRIGQGLPQRQEKLDLRQVFLPLAGGDVAALMEKARTMAATAKGCAAMEKLEAESQSELSGGLGVVDTQSLPADVLNIVRDLDIGVASEPISADGGVIFLMVCKRTGTAGPDILRQRIRSDIMNDRLDASARGYLRDLRLAAFLDLRI